MDGVARVALQACGMDGRETSTDQSDSKFGRLPTSASRGALASRAESDGESNPYRTPIAGSSEIRRPLGFAIVGGLVVSQFLTLYPTPVVYLYLDRLHHWLSGARAKAPSRAQALLMKEA